MTVSRIWFVFIPFLLLLYGCSQESDCFVADEVKNISVNQLDGSDYWLFLRTSGFGEKERFYELYEGTPKFNDCGVSQSKPIFEVHVDETEGVPVKLKISKDSMVLFYSGEGEKLESLDYISVEVNGLPNNLSPSI